MTDLYRIILSKRVAADLEHIFGRVARDAPRSAPELVRRVLDSIEGLKTFPHRTLVAGQRPGEKYPVRSLPVKPYVVFFRVIDDDKVVRVVHVRHGARRRPKRFE